MRLRLVAVIASVLAALVVGGWLLKRGIDADKRAHLAAKERMSREPGVLIPDPALSPGVIEIELIPAGPSIALPTPAIIRMGRETQQWSVGRPVRFEGMAGKRDQRVTVAGDYLAEGATLDMPRSGSGVRLGLRAIPIDPPMLGSTMEKQLEVLTMDRTDILLQWKQGNIVVSEVRVPRVATRDVLAAKLNEEWKQQGGHRDPSDRRFDRAIVRFEVGSLFIEIFPLVDALLVPQRTVSLVEGSRSVPAFDVSLQPVLR